MTYRCLIVLASASLLGCFDLGDDDCKQNSRQPGTSRLDEDCEDTTRTSGMGGDSGASGVGGMGGAGGVAGVTGGSGGVAAVTGGASAVAGMTGGSGGAAGMTGGSGGGGGVTGGSGGDGGEPHPCEECIRLDCDDEVNACEAEDECISIFACAFNSSCPLDDDECIDRECAELQLSLAEDDYDLEALYDLQDCLDEECADVCDSDEPLCIDGCMYAEDGVCDDGSDGAPEAFCDLGTDCTDCTAF